MKLEKPTNKLIKKYILKFRNEERYYRADQAITNLFNSFPENNNLEDILLKVSVINDMYSTQIYATFLISKHILKLNIDDDLKNGNPELVNKIASGHGIKSSRYKKEINFYSFATKYCNWHNQEKYAIYDQFAEKTLVAYKRQYHFSEFKSIELKNFKVFRDTILEFIKFFQLTNYNLKEVDKFLWIYGKELDEYKNEILNI